MRATDPSATIVRLTWAFPLGFASMALCELLVQGGRLGYDGLGLAVALAAATGLVPGLLVGLVAALAHLRGWSWPGRLRRVAGGTGALATPLVLALFALVVGWMAIEWAAALFERRPVDAPEDVVAIYKGGLALAVVPAAIAIGWVARRLDRIVTARGRAHLVSKAAATGLLILAAVQLAQGPYVLQFQAWAPAMVAAGAVVVALSWLPRTRWSPRTALGSAIGVALVAALGIWGSAHRPARALLLHDARLFPPVYRTMWAFTDSDGDGEPPTWLGGPDCDDSDPHVASWRPELPQNGVDDNCRHGDGTDPRPVSPPPDASPQHRSIILITIDTVRADHLDLYGYERQTMPRLRAWADRARWWSLAWAPSNHTGFSMLSMLSGQSPELLVREPEVLDVGAQKFTHWLPHRLGTLGYETVAISPALVATGDLPPSELRFEKLLMGPWDHRPKNRGTEAMQLVDTTLRLLEQRRDERPLFLWLHLSDPHARHEAHSRFGGTSSVDRYDDELFWVDLQLGRLLGAIETMFDDEAIVVVTSDHGEALGEHGVWGHGFSLHEPMLHVPLLIRAPGLAPGRIDTPASLTSLPATILGLIGEPAGPGPTDPDLLREPPQLAFAGVPFFWSEQRMEVAVTDGRLQLLYNRSARTWVLHDLETPPEQRTNLVDERPEDFERLRSALYGRLEEGR